MEDSNGDDAASQLLKLQRASTEASVSYWFGYSAYATLLKEFPRLWAKLSSDEMSRIRREFDSNLCFQPNGEHVDLRTVVFEGLSENERDQILSRIQCQSFELADSARFVLLADVDDTLLPGHDILGISGVDRSWHTDGQLYPGVSRLCMELCGARVDDYPVLLTARPPGLLSSLSTKVKRLAGVEAPRLGILPGARMSESPANAYRVMSGEYTQLKEVKVKRIVDYASLFPECAGRFIFIGDDGQGDFLAAEEMLDLRSQRDPSAFILAFVAIKAVRTSDGAYLHPLKERHERRERLLAKYPSDQIDGKPRWRFYYFDEYDDLASQLCASGWISHDQALSVKRAAERDRRPCLMQHVQQLDLEALQEGLDLMRPCLHELDEIETGNFKKADEARSQFSSWLCLPQWLPLDDSAIGTFATIRLTVNALGSDGVSIPNPYIYAVSSHTNGKNEGIKYEGDGQVEIPLKVFQHIPTLLIKVFASSPWTSWASPMGYFFVTMPRQEADKPHVFEFTGHAQVRIWSLEDIRVLECGAANVQYSFHDRGAVEATPKGESDEDKLHRSCQGCQTTASQNDG